MRLWSINPSYLDQKGLVALWREALLAQSVLLKGEYTEKKIELKTQNGQGKGYYTTRKIKTPYYNHPQLLRFKVDNFDNKMLLISTYLHEIFIEADKRGYKFDRNKIYGDMLTSPQLTVTKGQLDYEFEHLQQKLLKRCWNKAHDNEVIFEGIIKYGNIKANPIFKVIDGNVESWEKIK